MGRKLIAALSVVVLVVLAFAVLPSSSNAVGNGKPKGNCVLPDGNNGVTVKGQNGEVVFCQALDITKEVTGDAAGRTFPITVDCQRADKGMTTGPPDLPTADFPPFGPKVVNVAAGETVRLLAAGPVDCTITEDPPEGCTLTSIEPETVSTSPPMTQIDSQVNGDDPPPLIVHPVTVVNDCPAAAPAGAAPADAAPADVVQAQPTFTG